MKKKNNYRKLILCFLMALFLPTLLFADTSRFALGLGYPYLLVKYSPFEVKYASGDGTNVFAGRYYLNFFQNSKVRAFTGAEGGYVKFNTLDVKGNGFEGSIFIGGECFITDNIGFAIDLSPTYLQLKSDDSYKANGFEIVGNASVYYYFSGAAKK